MKITIRVSWCHSLKEKRMVVRSIIQKLKNKFNVSVSEVGDQDIHKSIIIGITSVCISSKIVHSTMENILSFIEDNCQGEIISIDNEEYIY